MLRPTIIGIALVLFACGGSQAAGPYGYDPPSGAAAAGPGYTTVYVDENGYIVGVQAKGPAVPYIGEYGEPFRLETLPTGAMSFGAIRVVPSAPPPAQYGY